MGMAGGEQLNGQRRPPCENTDADSLPAASSTAMSPSTHDCRTG